MMRSSVASDTIFYCAHGLAPEFGVKSLLRVLSRLVEYRALLLLLWKASKRECWVSKARQFDLQPVIGLYAYETPAAFVTWSVRTVELQWVL